jgi:hypothetical protein
MFKIMTTSALAAALVLASAIPQSQPAEAGRGRGVAIGVAAGVIGLGILGAYAGARARSYDRVCYTENHCYYQGGRCYINHYGEEVCRRGYKVCEPRRVCY